MVLFTRRASHKLFGRIASVQPGKRSRVCPGPETSETTPRCNTCPIYNDKTAKQETSSFSLLAEHQPHNLPHPGKSGSHGYFQPLFSQGDKRERGCMHRLTPSRYTTAAGHVLSRCTYMLFVSFTRHAHTPTRDRTLLPATGNN